MGLYSAIFIQPIRGKVALNPEEFIRSYEQALATQDWTNVESLVHNNACVTFSDGTVHKGKSEVRSAFERNFSLIKDERYLITNVHWVAIGSEMAVYLFDFSWSGMINDRQASGSGRGTSVLIKEEDKWQLLVEHLGPKAS